MTLSGASITICEHARWSKPPPEATGEFVAKMNKQVLSDWTFEMLMGNIVFMTLSK